MIDVRKVSSVYLAQGFTDLRKGIDGYSSYVAGTMQLDPMSSSLFLFCNRRKDKLKVLYWDGNGFWLFYKRLDEGKFKWPKQENGASLELNHQQLRQLLDGLNVNQKKSF